MLVPTTSWNKAKPTKSAQIINKKNEHNKNTKQNIFLQAAETA